MLYAWAQCVFWYMAKKHDALQLQCNEGEYQRLKRWGLGHALSLTASFVIVCIAFTLMR